jgi:hypothetical protein
MVHGHWMIGPTLSLGADYRYRGPRDALGSA